MDESVDESVNEFAESPVENIPEPITEDATPATDSQPSIAEMDQVAAQDAVVQLNPETARTENPAANTLADLFPPFELVEPQVNEQVWYLGLDFGTTGLSAVLLHRPTGRLYPIYWSEVGMPAQQEPLTTTTALRFRLPAIAYLSAAQLTQSLIPEPPAAVGPNAFDLASAYSAVRRPAISAAGATDWEQPGSARTPGLLLQNFKSALKAGIPYYSPYTLRWEPVLQWSDVHQVSLGWFQQALKALLGTLSPNQTIAAQSGPTLIAAVPGLEPAQFRAALSQLSGVTLGYPAQWPDTYGFNLREAILAAKLVNHPEKIFLIEDAIATALSGLRGTTRDWRGGTLVIDAGASTTELALVNIPENLQALSHSDFHIRKLAYAGNGIDQDIICQLLYPQWPQHQRPDLDFPLPGEPDLQARQRLQQYLESSAIGQGLLEAAKHLKVILQEQERFALELGTQQWVILRRDLEGRVFLPFIQRLNRELNTLLSQTGVPVQAINQAVCTGGTASLPAIARWLRQKLPNATIVQDAYADAGMFNDLQRSTLPIELGSPGCSRVAYGLATLPLYPQVLDWSRQQYSDYFLLLELLRSLSDQASRFMDTSQEMPDPEVGLSIGNIMQLLERRGINTRTCQMRILAILEGHLPSGLLPNLDEPMYLSDDSLQNPDYQALAEAPLFEKQGNQLYRPNWQQCQRLLQYLNTVLASSAQKLQDPLIIDLALASK